MTKEELISMVRSIAKHGADWRINEVLNRAADALEADEKRIDGLQKLVDINTERCEALRKQLRESHENYEKHLNELEAQMPKEGEWVELTDRAERTFSHVCSNCHRFHINEDEIEYFHFCPNCGARMKGKETDDGIHVRE